MRKILIISILTCLFYLSVSFANTQYIMDTDMGFDDWLAVIYLLKQPNITVAGITIDCQGETFCPQGAFNAARLTHLAKHDVPITDGRSRTLSRYDFPKSIRDYATNMAVPGFLHLVADHDIRTMSAAQFIFNTVVAAAKKNNTVVIISIGTATNISDAWKIAVKNHQTRLFRKGLCMIYKGGGAFGQIKQGKLTNSVIPGNIPISHIFVSRDKNAEWNIYANAPAMQTVLQAKLPITFIPDNASDEVNMTKSVYETLYDHSLPGSPKRFVANAMLSLVRLQGHFSTVSKNLDFWDTAATILALHPSVVMTHFNQVPLKIVMRRGDWYAATYVSSQSDDTVSVDYHLNKKRFYQLLFDGV